MHVVAKLVHCDIKPENILVTGENTVRLADFGCCQKLGANGMVLHRAASG